MTPSLGLTDVKGFPLRRVFARYRNAWVVLAASVLGYAMTTPFAKRAGVRQTQQGDTPLHAFCEPLLGLVQYVSTGHYGPRPLPFWEHSWLQDDVFVVRQSEPISPL